MLADDIILSELRYRRLFEAARDGILIIAPDTRKIVDVNPYLAELIARPRDDILGKEMFEIGLLRDEAESQAMFEGLRGSGFVRYDDLPLRRSDGIQVDVECVCNLYPEGGRRIIQCNIRDISQRKQSDARLRESEERFRLVSRAVSDVVWDLDVRTGLLWWSDGFYSTFGYSAGEVSLSIESWVGRLHPDDAERVTKSFQQAVASSAETWRDDYRFKRKDDTYASVQDCGYILRDAGGKALRAVGGMRDLTAQKSIEAEYLRAQRLASIGTMAAGIAHDLNNVLGPIMLSIELFRHEGGADSRRMRILNVIENSAKRGADLVRQVLAFTRGLDGERINMCLGPMIDELGGIIRHTFPRNILIETKVADALWLVPGQPTQVHQILLNLAINARDAMPGGGKLTVEVGNHLIGDQGVPLNMNAPAGPYILIEVTDTGQGMSPEVINRVFEMFFTTKKDGKGTGIGLATVDAIVKRHGGFQTVTSKIDCGSTFRIYLPALNQTTTAAGLRPRARPIPAGHGELVLIVDDESSIRDISRQILEAYGYRVLTASNGSKAVELITEHVREVAVMITDLMMPVLDGADTIEAVRKLDPRLRIIASSGANSGDLFIRAQAAGVSCFLMKPYTAETLLELLHAVLTEHEGLPDSSSNL
jgi:PAS domain S-box-containing protein